MWSKNTNSRDLLWTEANDHVSFIYQINDTRSYDGNVWVYVSPLYMISIIILISNIYIYDNFTEHHSSKVDKTPVK